MGKTNHRAAKNAIKRHPQLRHVQVEESEGYDVILRGTVGSFYLKQLAQEFVMKQLKKGRVINQIEVREDFSVR